MEKEHIDKKTTHVFVGVSGGVDSSVAAALLKKEGYRVTGVFIKIWHKDLSQCDWRQEMQDAMRVCAVLDIPFKMIDLSDVYMERVITYMIDAYKQGLTPNPDVMCNTSVKFGAFYDWAIQAGATHVATGHYAQVTDDGVLMTAIDQAKDQSYFLWNVSKDRLKHTFFPVGAYHKQEIRAMAQQFGLPTATKPDSQGLCFIGDVDLKTFLQQQQQTKPGDVLDVTGAVIGTHKGALLYTKGERHGFSITTQSTQTQPHYVIARDVQKNTITVSTDQYRDAACTSVTIQNVNAFVKPIPQNVEAVFRYHGSRVPARITCDQTSVCHLEVETPIVAVSEGQSAVLYDGSLCVGGGIIVATK